MRLQTMLLAAVAALSAGAAQAATIEIKDAVARVTVVPENRSNVSIEVVTPNAKLPLGIRVQGDRTIVDGGLNRKIRNCRGSGDRASVDVRDVGNVAFADMPQVVIHTPRDVRLETGGAVFGSVGRSASLELGNSGCGDWTVANVEGDAKISQAGSGDTRMGSSGALKVRVAGSGDVAAADVKGGLDVSIAGSGSANVKSISGPLEVSVAGSGDVDVGAGRATTMKVSIAGSGDVDFAGAADSLKARIAGSGDIRVGEVRGEVSKTIMGSGSVRIGN
ncbi:MAG: DUF2807 domain-containing protein [Alphaproteobacteria bacterium]|nr:DUF2807 domain-containing protein [Alphaproteobacteria bacterium]MBU1512602.1 DUF2807 domain-containing protein [Alphaproteobacteria bacterium]MBU2094996.1 DUF2807 domain-containing protein [Alphaproteobacteria bacterium]MBU2151885.1 DUF2807 domain-containing protein [Alphaproteobacteria bacterium]MBU2306284.1 DUF2807 domain-containing protein [Alphaproteobacteria bacterium]